MPSCAPRTARSLQSLLVNDLIRSETARNPFMQIRPLTEADYPGVQALHRSVGWPERSMAGWRWLHANPARLEIDAPAGWVVEGPDGEPAAHIGNLVHRFRLGDQVLHGATGFSIIVSPAVRGASRAMIRTFAEQPNIFAAWVFNANPRSQPLYARHGMNAWPEDTHALKLAWPVAPLVLVAGRLLRAAHAAFPAIAPYLGEWFMNDRLGRVPRFKLPPGVTILNDLGDQSAYAGFWRALNAEGRLLGDRSPAELRWRLSDPDLTTPPLILAFWRGKHITGYALAMMAKGNIIEAPVLEIIDLEALAGDAEAIPALMTAFLAAARPMGAAKVRLQTTTRQGLSRLGVHTVSARREGGWGHCHARFAPDTPAPALWSPTPWDADYAVCLRPVPLTSPDRAWAPARIRPTASKA